MDSDRFGNERLSSILLVIIILDRYDKMAVLVVISDDRRTLGEAGDSDGVRIDLLLSGLAAEQPHAYNTGARLFTDTGPYLRVLVT